MHSRKFMRCLARYVLCAVVIALLAACSGPTLGPSGSGSAPSANLLGILAVPAGAQAWSQNTNHTLSLDAFVQGFYAQSAWTRQEGLETQRGFLSGAIEGWTNPDGSRQLINIARFTTSQGALSMYDEQRTYYQQMPKPSTVVTDAAVDGVAWVSPPTAATAGLAIAQVTAHVGDTMIVVDERTELTPDLAGAEALMLKQYQNLKSGALSDAPIPGPDPDRTAGPGTSSRSTPAREDSEPIRKTGKAQDRRVCHEGAVGLLTHG